MEKLYELVDSGDFDVVVVDTPPDPQCARPARCAPPPDPLPGEPPLPGAAAAHPHVTEGGGGGHPGAAAHHLQGGRRRNRAGRRRLLPGLRGHGGGLPHPGRRRARAAGRSHHRLRAGDLGPTRRHCRGHLLRRETGRARRDARRPGGQPHAAPLRATSIRRASPAARWPRWRRTWPTLNVVADREEAAFADLAAKVAPAPLGRIPLFGHDVHDLGGLQRTADALVRLNRLQLPPSQQCPIVSPSCRRFWWPAMRPTLRKEIVAVISGPDVELHTVTSGPEVIAFVVENSPDLVIVDMQMGNMGGMAVCLELRLQESYDAVDHTPGAHAVGPPARCLPGQALGRRRLAGQAARSAAPASSHQEPPGRRHLPRRLVTCPCPCWWAPDPSCRRVVNRRADPAPRVANRDATPTETPPIALAPPRRGSQPDRTSAPPVREAGASEQERIIIDALADLRDMDIREVMTPRVDVTALTIPVHADDIARAVRTTGHSCFPVVHGDLDDLIGILFVNDIFRVGQDGPDPPRRHRPQPAGDLAQGAAALPAARDPGRAGGAGRHAQAPAGGGRGGGRVRRRGRAARPSRTCSSRWSATCGTSSTPRRSPPSCGWTATGGWSTARPTWTSSASAWAWTSPRANTSPWVGCSSSASATSPDEGEQVSVGDWDLRVVEMDKRRVAQVVATQVGPAAEGGPHGSTDAPE